MNPKFFKRTWDFLWITEDPEAEHIVDLEKSHKNK